ncbi:MAG: hypothetical protein ACLSS9_13955 [Acutalibacteraceae bacterium]
MNRKNRAIRCIALLGAALLLTGAIGGCSPKENASSAAPAGSENTSEEDTSNRPYTEKAIDLGGRDFTILMLGGSAARFRIRTATAMKTTWPVSSMWRKNTAAS